MKTIVLLLSLIGVLAAQKLRFDGHKLVELRIDSVEQMTKMLELEISSDQVISEDLKLDLRKSFEQNSSWYSILWQIVSESRILQKKIF